MTEISLEEVIQILDQNGYVVSRKAAARDYDKYLDQNEFKYILWLDRVFQKIQNVPGHIVEVGVARGRNAVLFGHFIKMHNEQSTRHYYGFDTFDGYTESDMRRSPHLSSDSWKETTLEFVQERVASQGLADVCHVFKGDIKAVANEFVATGQLLFNPNKLRIALLYIDCNAYLPAKYSMDFFRPYMMEDGIVCIDEKLQGGETEALVEFCDEHGFTVRKDSGPFAIPAYTRVTK